MNKVNIGLDIGISSVGWSVLDAKTFEIIKHGVRLFPFMEDPKTKTKLENENRRNARSIRRQINRKRNLKKDYIKFLKNKNWIDINIPYDNGNNQFLYEFVNKYINGKGVNRKKTILELRKKGQKEKLKKEDLIILLYWYLSSRGYKYEIIDEDKKEFEELKKKITNPSLLPIDIQWKQYQEKGYYRSTDNRAFSSKMYEKEIISLLLKSNVSSDFKKEYLALFNRQRSFEEGPLGNGIFNKIKDQKQVSQILSNKYNRFTLDKKGNLKISSNMWESSIGRCEFDNEIRSPKNSFSAEVFNLLNDLNNIKIGNLKLSLEDKKEILKISLENKKNVNQAIKYIVKKFNLDSKDNIQGFRIDKSKKEILTPLISWHEINKCYSDDKKTNIFSFYELIMNNFINENTKMLDEIIISLSKTKELEKRQKYIKDIKKINNYSIEFVEKISKLSPSFSQTHSFSINFIHKLLPELLNTNFNQMEIIHNNKLSKKDNKKLDNRKYIPTHWIDEEFFVASPTTKRAIRQSIKVINKIIKLNKNWKVENIVIEMARDLNGKQSKESENRLQKFLEKRKSEVSAVIGDTLSNFLSNNISKRKKSGSLKGVTTKVWLYQQQKGCDAYTGQKLDLNKVILDPSYTDIDHIIPYSLCHDDSLNNKVLTTSENNSKKGRRQPFQFLGSSNLNLMFSKWQEWYAEKSPDRIGYISPRKIGYLMDLKDYSKPENSFDFIGRNIVDTRYVAKEVLATFKDFIDKIEDDSHILKNTKVKTVNGRMTSFIRKMIEKDYKLERPDDIEDGSFDDKGKKIRIWNGHHAEDATIVVHAALKNRNLNKMIEKFISNPFISEKDKKIFAEEKLSNNFNKDDLINVEFIKNDLNSKKDFVYFSYMLMKKNTTKLFNETLYSGKYLKLDSDSKEQLYQIKKEPLYNMSIKKAEDIFEKNKIKVWTKMNDPKTFEAIRQSYLNTKTDKKAFPDEAFDEKNRLHIPIKTKKGIINLKIKNLSIVGPQKNEKDVILFSDHYNKTKKSASFKESLNWIKIFIYKDGEKNIIIPIDARNAKMNSDETKYNKDLIDIIDKKEGIFLYRGSILQDHDSKLWILSGHSHKNFKLELKPLWRKKIEKDPRHFSINSKLKGWKIADLDELGNRYFKKFEF